MATIINPAPIPVDLSTFGTTPDGAAWRVTVYPWAALPAERWGLAQAYFGMHLHHAPTPDQWGAMWPAIARRELAALLVKEWNVTDVRGAPLPIPWDQWTAVEAVPEAVWDAIWRALDGASDDALNAPRAVDGN